MQSIVYIQNSITQKQMKLAGGGNVKLLCTMTKISLKIIKVAVKGG